MTTSTPAQPRDPIAALAQKIYPRLAAFHGSDLAIRVTDILGCLIATPLALAGLVWLIAVTDRSLVAREWKVLLLMGLLMLALNKLRFFFIANLSSGGGTYGNTDAALDGIVRWSAILLFGPTALWVDLILNGSSSTVNLTRLKSVDQRWHLAREISFTIVTTSLFPLIAYTFYRGLGGSIPLSGLSLKILLLGASMLAVQLVLEALLLGVGYLAYPLWAMRMLFTPPMLASIRNLTILGLGVTCLSNLFAIPLASAYTGIGLLAYLVLVAGVILVAGMGRRFSQSMEDSRQQSVQLEKLEALGRAILAAPPDASTLPAILAEHVPAMFTMQHMGIWLKPDQVLLKQPREWPGSEIEIVREWMESRTQADTRAYAYTAREALPWQASPARHFPCIVAPILDMESSERIGGIYVTLVDLGRGWDRRALDSLLPTAQSLAAQVASALQQTRVYQRSLAQQKTQQELAVARRIQLSFLPKERPRVPGWQLATSLEPAREVAGDFYDLIPLPNGGLGILIADVADKGVGPALFMALSRTLVRTFALQYENEPAQVLEAANRRIIQDAGETLFVTVFYGVLDPQSGRLTYANAGHNPPWLFRAGGEHLSLTATGIPLGIEALVHWKQGTVQIAPGEMLMLYTDGATDAQNESGEFFGQERLLNTARAGCNLSAVDLHTAILEGLRGHIGRAPQFDDITLILVKRDGII